MEKTFGDIIQECRKQKGWTVREFIEKLGIDLSPAYITKIEIHGEIPSPELICRMADVFGLSEKRLWETAKSNKMESISETMEAKYQKVAGLYRQKKGPR